MKKELLKLMRCPCCGTDFEIEKICSENEKGIVNGLIRCECDEFPIIESILILKRGYTKEPIIKSIKKMESTEEFVALLFGNYFDNVITEDICKFASFLESKGMYGQILGKILLIIVKHRTEKSYKKYSSKNLSFYDTLGNNPWGVYLKHRFSLESFWSIYPFIPLLKKNKKRILDMCCGMGHVSFVISKYINPSELICVDASFSNLYLAKKYFAPDAEFICLDGNYPLPFKDGIFSSGLMMDAFHYIDARASLANELERVLHPEGLLLFLHVHNSLVHNLGAGKPLPPSVWINLFNDLNVKALPEKKVVEDFIFKDKLDLLKEYSENEINSSNAINIIVSKNKSLFDIYEKIGSDFLKNKRNLIINPLYEIRNERKKIVLERASIRSASMKELFICDCPLSEKYLPKTCIIDNEEVMKALKERRVNVNMISEENLRYIEELMMKFVIINAPQKYV